jgi:hypothetical protein
MALDVEGVIDGSVDRQKALSRSRLFETLLGIVIYERPLLAKVIVSDGGLGFAVVYPACECGFVGRGP